MSAIGPVRPPLQLRRLAALRVIVHPFRAARALGQLADEAATNDLMYRTAMKLCVRLHLGPRGE